MTILNEIRERLEKATKGPWFIFSNRLYTKIGGENMDLMRGDKASACWIEHNEDADFIVHSIEDIAYLLSLLDIGVEALEKVNKEFPMDEEYGCCAWCGAYENEHNLQKHCPWIIAQQTLARMKEIEE